MLVFDIKRYAIHDGPGIRTTIFVKGCPLRCVWCHNPESWSPRQQRLYKRNKCIGCGICIENCGSKALTMTADSIAPATGQCVLCGQCADNCPALAMEICGREWSIDELMAEVEKERGVMEQDNGGVTVSGGEPLMHPEALLALLKELGRRGFHRAVDTTLFASTQVVESIARECELFLVDLKCMDSEKHRYYTGVPNEPILENLRLISSMNHPYYIRIPLIAGVNSTEDNIRATVDFLLSLPRRPEVVDLLPYHDIGKGKHERMGSEYNPDALPLSAPTQEELERCKSSFEVAGFKVRIGG